MWKKKACAKYKWIVRCGPEPHYDTYCNEPMVMFIGLYNDKLGEKNEKKKDLLVSEQNNNQKQI